MNEKIDRTALSKVLPIGLVRLFEHRFIRFLFTSGINTSFSYGVYVLLVYLGLNYALANLLALLVGIFFSFKVQGRFVFENRASNLLFRYALCWFVIYVCNILLIKQAMLWGASAYLAGMVAIPFIAIVSYLAQKLIVFKKKS